MNDFENGVMAGCAFFIGFVIVQIVLAYREPKKKDAKAYDFRSPEAAANFYNQLSVHEILAIEALAALDDDSIWGLAIKNVIEGHSVEQFRVLIKDLKSQNNDNALVMECILGDAYDKVMAL